MRMSHLCILAVIVISVAAGSIARAGDLPLPNDVAIARPDAALGATHGRFLGKYVGKWDTGLEGILIVERVDQSGEASVVYAWGDFDVYRLQRGWIRTKGRISGDHLTLDPFRNGARAEYSLEADGSLRGTYSPRAHIPSRGFFFRELLR